MKHIKSLVDSGLFDPWETNVLMAGLSQLNEEQLREAEVLFGRFTVLDNATSSRMGNDFDIDLLPYQVVLDKDDKVVRLGAPKD